MIVAYEDMRSWGYGAEIAARIADELFEELDAPVRRVAAKDTFCAYQPTARGCDLAADRDIARRARISRFLTAVPYPIPCKPLRHNLHVQQALYKDSRPKCDALPANFRDLKRVQMSKRR